MQFQFAGSKNPGLNLEWITKDYKKGFASYLLLEGIPKK